MNIFSYSQYFWVAFIAVTCVNGVVLYLRARRAGEEDPELAGGFTTFVWGWFVWMSLPWVVMGLGNTVGGVPTFFHFLRPRDGNPWVLAFFASIIVLYAVTVYWVFLRDGAEVLARLQSASGRAVLGGVATSPALVKLALILALIGGAIGMVVLLVWNPPLPPV